MQNHSYGYNFYLHVIENSFSLERFYTCPRFEKEAKSNSEMGYLGHWCLGLVTRHGKSNIPNSKDRNHDNMWRGGLKIKETKLNTF